MRSWFAFVYHIIHDAIVGEHLVCCVFIVVVSNCVVKDLSETQERSMCFSYVYWCRVCCRLCHYVLFVDVESSTWTVSTLLQASITWRLLKIICLTASSFLTASPHHSLALSKLSQLRRSNVTIL